MIKYLSCKVFLVFAMFSRLVFAQDSVSVSFSVDMNDVETNEEGVYFAGGVFGQEGYIMSDSNGDDVWSLTLKFPTSETGDTKTYKFRNQPALGSWDGFEETAGIVLGGCNTGEYNDRFFVVPASDSTLETVCYGFCVACDEVLEPVNITFSVNMADEITSSDGVYFAGGNFGGSPPGQLMADLDGDDIWTITLPATPGSELTYKFANGPINSDWSGAWENVPAGCAVTDNDRTFTVPGFDASAPVVCFSLCTNCPMDIDPLVINDFNITAQAQETNSGGQWTEYDETAAQDNFISLSQLPADQTPDNDSPVMLNHWGVNADLGWGGYIGYFDIFDPPLDLSDYNSLSFKFNNLVEPSLHNSSQPNVEFRVILWDISDADEEYSTRQDVETWWAFFKPNVSQSPIMNATTDGWVEYQIPLEDNGRSDDNGGYQDGFANPGPGWGVGIAGNDALDIDQIGGMAIEIVISGNAVSQGEFLLEDIQAIYTLDVPGCMDETACNYDPAATVDSGLCYDCIEVEFSVDMNDVETHPDGVYFAGGDYGQEGFLMEDADEEDIWYVKILVPETEIGSTKNYKFRNQPSLGTWDGFEDPSGLVQGGCNRGDYNDRFFVVPAQDSTVSTVCYGSCFGCDVELETVDVTFAVDMSEEETSTAGVWLAGGNFGGNPGFQMIDPDGDDVWTVTLPAGPGTEITWKYVNGTVDANWNGTFENVPVACGIGEFLDRTFDVPQEDAAIDTVCFESCTSCIANYPVDVTFNLDMNDVEGFEGSGAPYVFGSYNNWDNFSSQTFLEDTDGDGIYTGTLSGPMFYDSLTYLYGYGQVIEEVPAICGIGDAEIGMYVREMPLSDDDGDGILVLDPTPFSDCPADNSPKVHLKVDVSSIVDSWPDDVTVCVVGSFNNWSNACFTEMSDDDGDDIYEVVIGDLESGENYEFKFLANEGWNDPIYESGAPEQGAVCDFNPNDSNLNFGFTAIDGTLDLGVFGWNECSSLSSDFTQIIPTRFSSKAYPNPFNPYVTISYELPETENVRVDIVNILGQNVKTLVNLVQNPGSYAYKWDGKDINGIELNSGMYFAIINRKSGTNILKITYLK